MKEVSVPQARIRFKTLSPRLQEAIFSEQTAEIINQTATQNHIDFGDIPEIASAAGLVLLGFIHPEDLAPEISDRLEIPSQTSAAIASTLNTKLFAPIKEELLAAYAPVPTDAPLAPQIINEAPAPTPKPETPGIVPPEPKAPAPMAPQKMSAPAASAVVSTLPTPKPEAPGVPAPMMLHKESEFAPTKAAAKIDLMGVKAPSPLSTSMATPAPAAARIEIGARTTPTNTPTGPTTKVVPPPPGNIKPAVDSSFPKTQLTAPTPAPSAAPVMPKISLGPVSLGAIAPRPTGVAPTAPAPVIKPMPAPSSSAVPPPPANPPTSSPAAGIPAAPKPAPVAPKVVNYSAPAPVAPKPTPPAQAAVIPPTAPPLTPKPIPVAPSAPNPPAPATPPPKIVDYSEPAPQQLKQ